MKYLNPKMEIIYLKQEDVVTASTETIGTDNVIEYLWGWDE